MIGTRLGPYRITEPLGAGGMGEVYRARDERLGRDMAVKVLPKAVADDPERMARFEREARALAALSHPNILAIYDFGDEGGITYAVTELLEGETLRHRLERERLPWRKSIDIAAAVSDGLAAAHGKGIIHRDIKPDNIFITTDGRVKVLDFGLARSIRHLEDAVAANPGDVDSLWYLTQSYSFHAGKPAAGIAAGKRLVSIDPLTVANLFSCAFPHWADGNFAQALALFEDMHRREPALRLANFMRMHMLARLGRMSDACSVGEEIVAENAEDPFAQGAAAFKHALLGERERLLALITGDFESHLWNDPESPVWLAGWFALVNERDRALDWLERWIDRGSINYPMLAHGDPLLQPLRGELRFQRLLDRIRPEWEQFVPRFQP